MKIGSLAGFGLGFLFAFLGAMDIALSNSYVGAVFPILMSIGYFIQSGASLIIEELKEGRK